ncbi:MAG: 50S ribosomal protein L6 [Candidatus Doudnabacteria bacterium RIFCSPHIGHO2_02_FULL_48_21]|uniref:Large ribosomal subunit protein uL6 n=1 Tax=Candidatus Doudnabacteria bacterium RIFCSPLOWO2_02_FULL_48_13 TaxID=1817845 RepID=A0A1F5QDB6_9BACT|nr:ribosomal protein L6 [uncultured bacterium]OGE76251.1 MAG: 50S ribosomal protein L6 [Candidatus Doudnabacteria bacterium RIFCSPHIGHO2_01_48_18]OGE77522.1 MAG: 50S ribosomal protein L6 [Candidatus Doudnabacteria bacterium RIFCSPHIGHO2_01_FULL_48_180]OGE91663.1 MAG: 50S ribosomal protein L6 [Candidatus Doudnabacteria bacterium RIFCSPHIGHO2_12_FULL_47_25]OGE93357.1 MAG: 50S ribosomal protein L6 [Candidatus Doudnabacteria bacterium RIFCSPHIGHO2_02_FULL_48_21]OGE97441.1 MAG: 50S ribosomal protei
MSKIGKKIIAIPSGVEVAVAPTEVKIKGPKGESVVALHPKVAVTAADNTLSVSVKNPDDRRQKALWGTFRSLIANAVTGVTAGFEKKLDIVGVGYKAQMSADKLILNLGYSHPIELAVPAGLDVKVEKNTITVNGFDKQAVGEFAALVRSQRKPEPYKGKGVKYQNEVVRRKAGKVVKAVGG